MANKVSFIIQLKDQFGRVASKVNRQFEKMKASSDKAKNSISGFGRQAQFALRKAERSARLANRELKKQSEHWKGLREQAGRFAKRGAVLTAGLTAPIVIMSRRMIQAASDATETANKFNSVFDDVRVNANQVADDFSKSFGVAGSTARKMIGDTGDLLVGFGFSGEAALEMSDKVARLASDLTSFQNFAGGAEGANVALTKALLGESEAAKALGIVVRQGTSEFKKNVQMIMRTQRVSLLQAKAIEILRIATSQSQKAIGDVNRTWDDYASVVRRNEEATKELSESFGKIMIPLATKLTLVLTKLVKWVDSLSPGMKKLVLTLGGLVAIGGPLLLVLSGIAAAFTVISLPVILVSAAVLGLIAVGILLAANWEEIVSRLKSMWEGFSNFIKNMFDGIGNGFSLLFEGRLIDAIKTFANVGISNLNALLSPLDAIASLLGFDAGTIKIPEFNVNVEDAVLKNGQAPTAPVQSVNGAINGQITVSAAPGSQVKQTSLTSTSSGLNVGMNMVPG